MEHGSHVAFDILWSSRFQERLVRRCWARFHRQYRQMPRQGNALLFAMTWERRSENNCFTKVESSVSTQATPA